MGRVFKAAKIFLAIFVLAGLIFAGTQSQDVFLGWVIGLLGVVNGAVLINDAIK